MLHVVTVFAPAVGALITGFLVRVLTGRQAHLIACAFMAISAICGTASLLTIVYHGPETVVLFDWIVVGSFESEWTLRVDALTGVMFFVVSFVSFLIHVYSLGYMEGAHDPHIPRFMCYISMFTFFMLMLVSSDSIVQLFFGWEGVGLASYLLIGFWYTRPAANAAAIKAFVVNRVADFAFMLGIAATFMVFDSVQFDTIFANAAQYQDSQIVVFGTTFDALNVVTFLLFVGAMGKSAQLGLHTWLPDAMEGPTPISALIHAATMVTAGVFLVARMSPVFEYAPDVLAFVAFIGGSTAFFAATIAIVQTDIKRVVAYSTCSQLGYMFAACGVSAYSAGIFHLATHAFFKSLLFLACGSVITAVHEEQDMRRLGGLWRKLPITYAVMWIGALALGAIPFFAGYYSKDFILEATWASHASFAHWAYWGGTLGAGLTSLYIFRLIFLTFHGKFRGPEEVFATVHESPPVMTVPLLVLALGAAFGGMIGLPLIEPSMAIWGNSIFVLPANDVLEAAEHIPALMHYLPLILALMGAAIAFTMYILKPEWPALLVPHVRPIYVFLIHKWYFDELYDFLFVRPAKWIGYRLWQRGDLGVIDAYGPDGLAAMSVDIARRAMRLQTGYLYHYAFAMLIGVALLVTWYLFVIQG
ncbi:MAG TPA: NADH-quinone oxidoreductase subunit L [Geminicoccaceae bacterium]|nr:NADH-quinone oxidoreductase subunit L [Geminicoccaceae bacterium]